jgi:hypothetical protein
VTGDGWVAGRLYLSILPAGTRDTLTETHTHGFGLVAICGIQRYFGGRGRCPEGHPPRHRRQLGNFAKCHLSDKISLVGNIFCGRAKCPGRPRAVPGPATAKFVRPPGRPPQNLYGRPICTAVCTAVRGPRAGHRKICTAAPGPTTAKFVRPSGVIPVPRKICGSAGERGVTTGSKIMFSLSSVILFWHY